MLKNFPIDFVRQFIEQALLEEHIAQPQKFFGGKDQVNLFSFYEQLQKEDEVDRYVEIYRDLTEQQNRTNLIMNGTIVAPENPTITNINQCLIIPMSFTCSFRVKLGDRDMALETINNLIEKYKGRHIDIAEFDNGKILKVGTVANEVNGAPYYKTGDFIGFDLNSDALVKAKLATYVAQNITSSVIHEEEWYYVGYTDFQSINNPQKMAVVVYNAEQQKYVEAIDNGTYTDIVFPPSSDTYTTFTPLKLSVSFDALRCDEPRNLNANEYCVISFSGSATLVSLDVALGNDLTKLGIYKNKIVADTDISILGTTYWLEPLELPSGNGASTLPNKLLSNKFVTNTHTDSVAITMQYTFILDKNIPIIYQWWKYARYGIQADGSEIAYANGITPNMIYKVIEIWSYWGFVEIFKFNAKIIESIDIENSESDTLTITIPLQVQGDNN